MLIGANLFSLCVCKLSTPRMCGEQDLLLVVWVLQWYPHRSHLTAIFQVSRSLLCEFSGSFATRPEPLTQKAQTSGSALHLEEQAMKYAKRVL